MSPPDVLERYAWWASLNHGGLLISPSKLAEHFPETLPPLSPALEARLRRDLVRLREGGEGVHAAFLDTVLEDVLDLNPARWLKGSQVDKSYTRTSVTREALRPRRVWLGNNDAVLPVFVAERDDRAPRPGVGRGRRDVARVIEWLRKAGHKVALLAGGRHLRLIHAGSDYDAFCEWDTDLWFQEGAPSAQVTALRALLGKDAIVPEAQGKPSRLLAAIQATRQGQAELSTALGERVRLAVETLIRESSPALETIDAEGPRHVDRRDLYIAATRIVMRCVVILFAEARGNDLLPRNNPVYESSYGINSLRNQLDRLAGARAAEHLRHSQFAWPRLLALFALLYDGSAHEALPVTRYGGGLFAPGDDESPDPILRALAAFEGPANAPSDAAIHRMLELLCKSPVKVRQGRASKWVEAPVDFSDLSSEYLGILYEGLLDFELRRAPKNDAMVFLDLGDEPVLSIDRLDRMTNEDLAQLLAKLAKATKKNERAEDEGADDEGEEESEDQDAGEGEEEKEPDAATEADPAEDETSAIREKIQTWAERAVKAAKLVKYPKNDKDPRVREAFNEEVTRKAKALVRKAVMPGSWFLVRWGGTRKGSGTFYTRPQLAGPTVRRALAPLVYDAEGQADQAPKTPENILALKVCDPAMGSGSFLISALRFLTDVLYESLHHHGRIEPRGDGIIPRLADGLPADHPWNEPLPVPQDHPDFEQRVKARLKRYVVERCIYGVDLDPLAVELAKTALWIETMDPSLPFGFVDHKLKCGNALVGCWFDRFQDYPIMAWEREGGDKGHDKFVRHYREFIATKGKDKGKTVRGGDKWTAAIKERRDEVIRPELRRWLEEKFSKQVQFEFAVEGKTAENLHDEALAVFEKMHALRAGDAEGRERMYKEEIEGNNAIKRLREAFDTWCALWFWPGDELKEAPGPMALLAPSEAATRTVRRVTSKERFFHWEIEFPDVFARSGSGFDAMVGNPPWEIQKPNSMEFFSNIDPLYRTYSKQDAIERQVGYFSDAESSERDWVAYNARIKAASNWARNAANLSGADDHEQRRVRAREDEVLLERWRARRERRQYYSGPRHPFERQGAGMDVNTYKMFLEMGHSLLGKGGCLGFLVPSGIYTDKGSRLLRELFLRDSSWTHLYAFQNERFVFEGIDHRFKMSVVHVRKTGSTSTLLVRFRLGPGDSPEIREVEEDLSDASRSIALPVDRIKQFSPSSGSILELHDARDLSVLEKMYNESILFGDDSAGGWRIVHRQEFHMTHDAMFYLPYHKERDGGLLETPIDGLWTRASGLRALPLVQGIAMDQFNYNAKGWLRGTGVRAVWERLPFMENPSCRPQFIVDNDAALSRIALTDKIVYRRIARSTDARTIIATAVPGYPVGDVTPTVRSPVKDATFSLLAILNSYAFDSMARLRCGGTHVDYHVIAELPLPKPGSVPSAVPAFAMRLGAAAPSFARVWSQSRTVPWRRLWAVTPHERLRLRSILDAVVAHLYGLDLDDFSWILRDCDHPVAQVCDKPFSRTLDPKGFWRVDKDKDPELRHPVLSLVAFHELQRMGLDAFLAQNEGEGWMLPETLRLADYGLGHDERAKEAQPVASRLGERFLTWQLAQGVEESWEECRRHAETIEKILTSGGKRGEEGGAASADKRGDAGAVAVSGKRKRSQLDLFDATMSTDDHNGKPRTDPPPSGTGKGARRPGSSAREGDPRQYAEILGKLARFGTLTADELVPAVPARRGAAVRMPPMERLEGIRRELERIGWIEGGAPTWTLTEEGRAVASHSAPELARDLCVAHDRVEGRVVGRLVERLWQLAPERQGAVLMVLPDTSHAPEDVSGVRAWLGKTIPLWMADLVRVVPGWTDAPSAADVLVQVLGVVDAWDQKRAAAERRKRLQEALLDRLYELLFGEILPPADVRVWQTRMDWAGLTFTARRLPGVQGRVWFPVGAFREPGDAAFTPVSGLQDAAGATFHRHSPTGAEAERRFADVLYDAYVGEQQQRGVEYVSLLAVRDAVCYRLRIGASDFERLLQTTYERSLARAVPYTMAVEVDINPADRARLGNTILVNLDGVPHFILSMRRR